MYHDQGRSPGATKEAHDESPIAPAACPAAKVANMEKRYQVFVSSTFADLKEERGRVIQTLIEMDCIPAGMELFPAVDEEQLVFIKRVIDDCDYYVVIVGGRYGTQTADGVSYTEKEYEYAVEKGLKVIALLRENPQALPAEESDSIVQDRLHAFRARLKEGRIVKFWTKPDDLPGLVALSLQKTIKMYPALGWIRASREARESLLEEIAEVRRQNEKLEAELRQLRTVSIPAVSDLAGLDDKVTVRGSCKVGTPPHRRDRGWSTQTTWREMFISLSPFLMDSLYESGVNDRLAKDLFEKSDVAGSNPAIESQSFQDIKIQLMAMQLVDVRRGESVSGSYPFRTARSA